jgi:rare lipoprotein A
VRTLLWCLLVASLLTSCTRQHVSPPPSTPPVPGLRIQYGLASWYGHERHGQRTASGELYDSTQLTAAHRKAPLGIYALVTNLDNGRTVRVRINDRGPATRERMLDLSYAAARQLGMVRVGVARVKVEFLIPSASLTRP